MAKSLFDPTPDPGTLNSILQTGQVPSGSPTGSGGMFDMSGPGWQNILMGLALMDAGRPRPFNQQQPLMATLAPIMQMQAQQAQRNKAFALTTEAMKGLSGGLNGLFASPDQTSGATQPSAITQPSAAPGGLFAPTVTSPDAGAGQLAQGGALGGATTGAIAGDYAPLIQKAAADNNLPADVFARQIAQESSFNPNAKSPAGALGIAQFMPDTARRFGIDPMDPNQAIPAAAQYVAKNRDMFGGNLGLALAGYNWGEGKVQKWLQSGADSAKMPSETRQYVANITGQPIDAWLSAGGQAPQATAMQGRALPQQSGFTQLAQATPQTMTDAGPQRVPRWVTDQTAAGPVTYDANEISGSPTAPVAGDTAADLKRKDRLRQQDPYLGLGPSGLGSPAPTAAPAQSALAQSNPTATQGQAPQPFQMPAPGQSPTPQQVAQARALLPAAPPVNPQSVTGAATQRAAAIKAFQAGLNTVIAGGLLGDDGKGIVEAGKSYIDLAKGFLTPTDLQKNIAALPPQLQQQFLIANMDKRPEAQQNAAFAYPGNPAMQQQVVANSLTDNSPAHAGAVAAAQAPYKTQALRPGAYAIDGTGRVIAASPMPIQTVDAQGNKYAGFQMPPMPGQPQGAVSVTPNAMTAIGPGTEAALTTRAKEEQEQRQKVINDASAAQQSRATLMSMVNESGKFVQGPFSQHAQTAASYLRLINPAYNEQVASNEDYTKNAGLMTRQATRELSAREAVQGMQMVANSLPNPDMSPAGLQKVQNELIGQSDYKLAKAQAQQQWEQQNGGIGNVSGFETAWQKQASPYAFIVARMAPEDRQQMIAKLQTSNQGRQELARLGQQLQYLKQSGLAQ